MKIQVYLFQPSSKTELFYQNIYENIKRHCRKHHQYYEITQSMHIVGYASE
jgi:hypothetical protein